jgi:hypothetical protein
MVEGFTEHDSITTGGGGGMVGVEVFVGVIGVL